MARFVRPKAEVLPDSALVPEENVVSPPPTQFSHELPHATPYYFASPQAGSSADGNFSSGTKVVLVSSGPEYCRVIDAQGLSVFIPCAALAEL